MKARSAVTVAAPARVSALHCEPPLTVRQVGAAAGRCGLCLVGSAAGPLAGDDLELVLQLDPTARAELRAAGATIAQGHQGGELARLRTTVSLGRGARLRADPGPVVVCAGANLAVSLRLELGASAAVEWHELVVLGRTGEPSGDVTVRWDVTRDARPLLRQFVDLANPRLRVWAGMTGGRRIIASTLVSGPHVDACTVVAAPTAVAQRLAADTVLITVLGDDAADVYAQRAELAARIAHGVYAGPHGRPTVPDTPTQQGRLA